MNPHGSMGVRMLTIIGMIESEWWGWAVDFEDKLTTHSIPVWDTLSWDDAYILFHTKKGSLSEEAGPITLEQYYGEYHGTY